MKKIITLFCFMALSGVSFSQQSSDYFPDEPGFVWDYRATPLDSLNNKIDSLAFARRDSFAVVAAYQGKTASIVPTKSGPFQTINIQPYTDSMFYNFDGTTAYDFFDLGPLEIILAQLDSLQIDTAFSFLGFFKSLESWYSVYRFASGVNTEYTLISKDTIINTPIGPKTFRFEYIGTRLDDENLQTAIGNFNCKKFFLEWKVKVFLLPPPFPPTTILTTENTVWIAPDYWIVKDLVPTNHIDLSFFGVEPFSIPGLLTEIEGVTNVEENFYSPETFYLSQNYPNPFNPNTKISWQVPVGSWQTLKIYDVRGKEVATLVDEFKPAGIYEVEFDASSLSSGIYFYKISSGIFTATKKMVYLK